MEYNEAQKRAAAHGEGPMLVLAGPGSGKTAVITERTARLVREGVAGSRILVVTFTRAAAAEMKSRFLNMAGGSARQVTFGTFHGVFYGILRNTYHINGNNILSEEEKRRLLLELLDRFCPEEERDPDLSSGVAREISTVKCGRIQAEHFYSSLLPEQAFRRIYREYGNWMREQRKLDFDDIMTQCWQLFRKHPEILALWQKKFQYILVDEFQDISPIQYDIVKMLAAPENNLFIVGDDDQSIYRFRGASPEIMLNFPRDYPEAETVNLNVNYRCTPEILEASVRLIRRNQKRFAKELRASRDRGEPVRCLRFPDSRSEMRAAAEEIRRAMDRGEAPEETALLFRTNLGCRRAVEQLMAYQIPFVMRDAVPCIYDHWIARQICGYLRLGAGSRRRSDFLLVCNKPNRYLSREAFQESEVSFEDLYRFYEDRAWMTERIEKLEADILALKHLAPFGAVQYIRKIIGYEGYLKEYAAERNLPEEELFQILEELTDSAREFDRTEDWFRHMGEYREQLKNRSGKRAEAQKGVAVSTLHAAKGMEYDRVYILDVSEGVIPWHKAVLPADLEEERRMLYVGMTRARKSLRLSWAESRMGKEAEPSRFLKEIFGRSPGPHEPAEPGNTGKEKEETL